MSDKSSVLPSDITFDKILKENYFAEYEELIKRLMKSCRKELKLEEYKKTESKLHELLDTVQSQRMKLLLVSPTWHKYITAYRTFWPNVFCDATPDFKLRPVTSDTTDTVPFEDPWVEEQTRSKLELFVSSLSKSPFPTRLEQLEENNVADNSLPPIESLWLKFPTWFRDSQKFKDSFDSVLRTCVPKTLVLTVIHNKCRSDILDILQHCVSVTELRLYFGRHNANMIEPLVPVLTTLPWLRFLELDSYLLDTTLLDYLHLPRLEILSLVHRFTDIPTWDVDTISQFIRKHNNMEACFLRGSQRLYDVIDKEARVDNLKFPWNLLPNIKIFKIEVRLFSFYRKNFESDTIKVNEHKNRRMHSWAPHGQETCVLGWNTHENMDHLTGGGGKYNKEHLFQLECDDLKTFLEMNESKDQRVLIT